MFNLKALAKKLNVSHSKVLKDLAIRHRKKFFCKYDSVWYQFNSAGDVIVPYAQAQQYAFGAKRDLPPPINIHEVNPNHLTRTEDKKIPVVVLLGHYNHGKTTLLDAIAKSAFVEDEKHGITQVIRTQLVSSLGNKMTLVDTPGQEVFYRMRSYGASIADMAVLMVAADDGIGPQTEESIGIVEELGIPVVVCINKVDVPAATPAALRQLEVGISEYNALTDAPVLHISAKNNININALLEKLQYLAKMAPKAPAHTAEQLEEDLRATDGVLMVGTGTVLNILKNRQQGTALHVIVRHGEVRTGDWFSAGGWCGAVRSLQHNRPAAAIRDTSSQKTKGKKAPTKGIKAEAGLTDVDPDCATPGMAVLVMVTLHEEANEPRPIGDTVRFHRDAWTIKQERKSRALRDAAAAGVAPSSGVKPTPPAVEIISAGSAGDATAEPALKCVPDEKFSTAKEAAEYCMERAQLDVQLASYAVTPSDAARFGLERLCTVFERQKPGFRGKALRHRIFDGDAFQSPETVAEEQEDDDDGELSEEVEEGSEGSADEEEKEDDDEEVSAAENELLARTKMVLVKADSDVTLGTLQDQYEDIVTKLTESSGTEAAAPSVPINQVMYWGIGEVGLKDVNMAKAGDALIIAYNVGVEKSAARLALNVNVKIARHDHIQEAANAAVGEALMQELTLQ